MYSCDERMTAIQHLIQNQFNYTITVMELGYPTSTIALRLCYKEYQTTGELQHKDDAERKYSKEERVAAVKYFFENGQNIKENDPRTRLSKPPGIADMAERVTAIFIPSLPKEYHPCILEPIAERASRD